jgi:hypothetical protein
MLQQCLKNIPDVLVDLIFQYHNPEYYYHDDGLLFNNVIFDNQLYLIGNYNYVNLIEKLARYVIIYPYKCDAECNTKCCVCRDYIHEISEEHLTFEDYTPICNSINCFVKYCHINKIPWKSTYDFDETLKPFPYKLWKYNIEPPIELQEYNSKYNDNEFFTIPVTASTYINELLDHCVDSVLFFPKVSDIEQKYYPFCNELMVVGDYIIHSQLCRLIIRMTCGDILDIREYTLNTDYCDKNYLTMTNPHHDEELFPLTYTTHILIRRIVHHFIIEVIRTTESGDMDSGDTAYTYIEFDLE